MPTIQDHIHLGLTLGGAPENAPTATYTVMEDVPEDELFLTFNRALNGTPHWGYIPDAGGDPVLFVNMRYTLRCTWDEYLTLRTLAGKKVYLVPNEHPADGADHTSALRVMLLDTLSYRMSINQVKEKVIVELHLSDLDTVDPLV